MGFITPTSVGGGLVLVWFGYFIIKTFLSYWKLRHIKGPWLASISPAWLFYQTVRGKLYLASQEVLEKYGRDPLFCFLVAVSIDRLMLS